jgi:hypothetical protein
MLGMLANVKLCCNCYIVRDCCLICVDWYFSFVELFMGLHVWWLCASGSTVSFLFESKVVIIL